MLSFGQLTPIFYSPNENLGGRRGRLVEKIQADNFPLFDIGSLPPPPQYGEEGGRKVLFEMSEKGRQVHYQLIHIHQLNFELR